VQRGFWIAQELPQGVARNKGEESISGYQTNDFSARPLFLCISPVADFGLSVGARHPNIVGLFTTFTDAVPLHRG
jgi:hypothetical protein